MLNQEIKEYKAYNYLYDRDEDEVIRAIIRLLTALYDQKIIAVDKDYMASLIKERGDLFTSDREIAALIIDAYTHNKLNRGE